MKKILVILGVLLALLVVVLVIASFYIGSIVKAGVQAVGPKVTKVAVILDSASLSPFSGHGTLKGLSIGNPEGYKAPASIRVGVLSVSVQPSTVFSSKVVVRSLKIDSPEITAEDMGGNLNKLRDNINASLGSEPSARRFQVDELVIQNGRINLTMGLLGGKGTTIPLPPIHLKDLGRDGQGLSGGELAQKIVAAVLEKAIPAIAENAAKLGKDVIKGADDAVKGATDLLKGAGGLFK
ncbi:MAG: hypothetical protein PHV34_10025 [Verrucomicrobiae bacterium]|nr:hypothetical protein [Verrucomicrobiae bacterium]